MHKEQFDKIVKVRIEKINALLESKGIEYTRSNDRLSNFKRAAALQQCSPEKALAGMWSKHLVSILDMIDDIERGRNNPPALWQEKIGDTINYLILLEALVEERMS